MSTSYKTSKGLVKKRVMYFKTSNGLDMYKLQLVDELVRRIMSYAEPEPLQITAGLTQATSTTPVVEVQNQEVRLEILNDQPHLLREWKSNDALYDKNQSGFTMKEIKKHILDLASFGPGFLAHNRNPTTMLNIMPAITKTQRKYQHFFSKIALEDAYQHLTQIQNAPPLYHPIVLHFVMGLASGGCCGLFFNGNWLDVLLSSVLGIFVSLLSTLTQKRPQFSRVYEFSASLLVSFIIWLLNHSIPGGVCFRAVVLSAVIWLLQGITITMSIIEMLTKKTVPGTVRLFQGIIYSALLGFGMDIGTHLYAISFHLDKQQLINENTVTCSNRGISAWFYPLLLLVTTLSFSILCNAHHKQLIVMTLISCLTYLCYYYLQLSVAANTANILSALTAALLSNLYSKYTGHPSIIYTLSALLLLVPGSVAVSGFYAAMQGSENGGSGLALSVLMTGLGLSVGIFMASLIVGNESTEVMNKQQQQQHSTSGIVKSELIF